MPSEPYFRFQTTFACRMHTGQAVSRVLSRTVIPLGIPLPVCSSNLPERSAGSVIAFCLVLLRMGFGLPHIVTKCAVRPYRTFSPLPVLPKQPSAVLLSVPLSVALPRPAVNRHSTLRSPDFPPRMPYAIRGDCLPVPCAARIITRNAKMPSETVQVSDGIQPKLHALFQAGFDKAVQVAIQYGFGVADFVACAQVFDT